MIKHCITLLTSILIAFYSQAFSQTNVTATIDATARTATMSNGIITLSINSGGQVSSLLYNGKQLIDGGAKFYLDYTDTASNKAFSPNALRIEKQTNDYAEIVYTNNTAPITLEQGYILMKNVSGIYTYVTVKGTATPLKVREMRIVYRVSPTLFTHGYVTDKMQGQLPSVADMIIADPNPIMDATYKLPDGTIYTKYNWTNYIVQDSVHGIMSANEGVWAIPVSHEYVNGGPMKQELTVHTTNKTPLVLQMLQGEHMGASLQTFKAGDQKMYGPFFIYLNNGTSYNDMIADAKKQVPLQKAQWPFKWLTNTLYPLDRTTVTGNINISHSLPKKGIQVVLAQPGSDIYDQGKQYMFWGLTDENGNFRIDNVRPGTYTLYTYATQGEITDEMSFNNMVVSGATAQLGTVTLQPVKYENLLWQIGENDRMTTGFRYSDTIRQYGLYDLPPANLNYTIGTSKPEKDWYYAQTKTGTWTVTFDNQKTYTGNAVLSASIAGAANSPNVDVYVNGAKKTTWSFTNDASIYRSAVLGGRHSVRMLTFPASLLVTGQNTIKFTISNVGNRGGVMYDCIKLEAGNQLIDSNDATLSDLRVNGSTVNGFAIATATYHVVLPGGTTIIPIVTATASESHAAIIINQASSVNGTATVMVTAQDGTTQKSYSINFIVSTAVSDLMEEPLKISNRNEIVTITSATLIQSITITDISGKFKFSKSMNFNSIYVDTKNWNSGVYVFTVQTLNGVVVKKVSLVK